MKILNQQAIEDTILSNWLTFTEGMENTFFCYNEITFLYENQMRRTHIYFNTQEATPKLFELLANYYYSENTVSLANKQKILEHTFEKNSNTIITFEKEHIIEQSETQKELKKYYTMQKNYIENKHEPNQEIEKLIDRLETSRLYSVSANDFAAALLAELIQISTVRCQHLEDAIRSQMHYSVEINVSKETPIEPIEHSEQRTHIKRILNKRSQPPIESSVSVKGPTHG